MSYEEFDKIIAKKFIKKEEINRYIEAINISKEMKINLYGKLPDWVIYL